MHEYKILKVVLINIVIWAEARTKVSYSSSTEKCLAQHHKE